MVNVILDISQRDGLAGEPGLKTGARYLYGIAECGQAVSLGKIGIDGSEVYTIPYLDICAIVHDCLPTPYQSRDEEKVKNWLLSHLKVLDEAKIRFGNVIPFSFDTILGIPKAGCSGESVTEWLKGVYERLHDLMNTIKGKDEYGIKVFYDAELVKNRILQKNELAGLQNQVMTSKSPGMAYICRQRLEKEVRSELGKYAHDNTKTIFQQIKPLVDDITLDKLKKADNGKTMLLNLSCLVAEDKVKALSVEVGRINSEDGLSVHFSGPWPPFSFVTRSISGTGEV